MKITISLEVPEGTTYVVEPVQVSAEFVPPFEDELIPLPPEAIPVPGDPAPFRAPAARQAQVAPALCPVHHEPWKTVPAGISKKTGQPYSSFAACPVRGCPQRPAA